MGTVCSPVGSVLTHSISREQAFWWLLFFSSLEMLIRQFRAPASNVISPLKGCYQLSSGHIDLRSYDLTLPGNWLSKPLSFIGKLEVTFELQTLLTMVIRIWRRSSVNVNTSSLLGGGGGLVLGLH